jgi:hypothetical protein
MFTCDKDEFLKWQQDFINRNGGIKVPHTWFDEVEANHAALREKLGGVTKVFTIEFKESIIDLDFKIIHPLTWDLVTLIPRYFHEYKLRRIDLKIPVVQSGKQFGMRRAKHIQFWMKKNNVSEDIIKVVNNILSKLGEHWSAAKTKDIVMKVMISTDPKAFSMIGHYGPDNGSCFRQRSSNQLHKYHLGRYLNSYVVLVGETDNLMVEDTINNPNAIVKSRAWGLANKDLTIYSVLNNYTQTSYHIGNVYNALSMAFGELLGIKNNVPEIYDGRVKVTNAYQNSGFIRSFCTKETIFEDQDFVLTRYNTNDMCTCYRCSSQIFREDSTVVDDNRVCSSCLSKIAVCFVTKKPTLQSYDAKIDGQIVKISYRLVSNGQFRKCEYNLVYYPANEIVELRDGSNCSKEAAEKLSYKPCPSCNLWAHWSRFRDEPFPENPEKPNKICIFCVNLVKNKKEMLTSVGL